MTGFNKATALANCQRLVAHANCAFKKLYSRYTDAKEYLPMQVMFRCFALARCLIIFELTALICPDQIVIDPLQLLLTQGGFLFNSYCGPTGDSFEDLATFAYRYTSSCGAKQDVHQSREFRKVSKAWLAF